MKQEKHPPGKRRVLKIFVKFIGTHLRQSLFFNKVADEVFKNSCFEEHLRTVASETR